MRTLAALLLVSASVLAAPAFAAARAQACAIGDLTLPKTIDYPQIEMTDSASGTLDLAAHFDRDGHPESFTVLHSSHQLAIDRSVLAILRQSTLSGPCLGRSGSDVVLRASMRTGDHPHFHVLLIKPAEPARRPSR